MRIMIRTAPLILGVGLWSCGSTNGPGNLISVGGTYATAVTLGQNTCGNVTVQPNPTTVTHTAGATTLSLTHAGNTYNGTLSSGGTFTMSPLTLSSSGQTFTIGIQGTFSTTGFQATVTVDVQQPGPPPTCQYVVQWVGTKNGAPNTIP